MCTFRKIVIPDLIRDLGSMRFLSVFFTLFFAVLAEAFFIPVPLMLLFFLFFVILFREAWVVFVGIFFGCILDSLLFVHMGESSLFFIIAASLIFLYGRKFEVEHMGFGLIFSTLASWLYLLVIGQAHVAVLTLLSLVVALILFGSKAHMV